MKTATIVCIIALLLCWNTITNADLGAWYSGGTLSLTNSLNQVDLMVNGFSGQTNDLAQLSSGGTNYIRFNGRGGMEFSKLGTVSDPVIVLAGRGTNWGIGSPDSSTIAMTIAGLNEHKFETSGRYEINSATARIIMNSDLLLTYDSTATLQLGVDSASPVNQCLKGPDGLGTDKSGGNLTIEAGQSTGAGVPGDIIVRNSLYTNSSVSTANAYTERWRVVGRPCALTNATATSFQRFTMATNTQAGINLFCTVKATDAAFARQSISSDVRVDAVNVNGTITATLSETDNALAASTGTLTIAYTVVDEGFNVLAIRVSANTSLTATPSIKWVIQSINSDGAITVTPVQL